MFDSSVKDVAYGIPRRLRGFKEKEQMTEKQNKRLASRIVLQYRLMAVLRIFQSEIV